MSAILSVAEFAAQRGTDDLKVAYACHVVAVMQPGAAEVGALYDGAQDAARAYLARPRLVLPAKPPYGEPGNRACERPVTTIVLPGKEVAK